MTEEEFDRAYAEWSAMLGTPPNEYSFRSNAEISGRLLLDVIKEMRALHPKSPWVRVTHTDQGVWLEAWDERPYKEAPFNPPMRCAP